MVKRLILHIGQYKTGSTSIQNTLRATRAALARGGVLFPASMMKGESHGLLSSGLKAEMRGGAPFDPAPLLAEIEQSGCHTVILSCEMLSGARVDWMDDALVAGGLARLGRIFDGWAITVIYYYRRQDEAVESRIIQRIKGLASATDVSIDPYLVAGEALDYGHFHRLVAEALPQATIDARCHGAALLTGGEVVRDFLHATGTAGLVPQQRIARANVSPTAARLEVRRVLNVLRQHGFDTTPFLPAVWRSAALDQGPKAVVLTPGDRRRIMDWYAGANARFVQDVVPPAQRAAVAAYLGAPVSEAVPNLAASAAQLAEIITRTGASLRLRPASTEPDKACAVRIHLGAHKTASSHLQAVLRQSRPLLEAHGTTLAYPDELRVPGGWLASFYEAVEQHKAGAINPATRARLRAPLQPEADWLLTEENILGTAGEVLTAQAFYSYVPPRFATLAEVFADRRIEVFMALRSYDGFLASIYAELVRNRGWMPFAEFRAAAEAGGWSWVGTVGDLVAGFGEASVTLWDYADFDALQPRTLTALTGIADSAPLIEAAPRTPTRVSLSATTLDLLGRLTPALGRAEAQALAERIDAHHGVAAGGPRFDPWTPAEREALRARYRADLAEIRSRWPAIRFLVP